ncbi:MORN repeat-containing protein [Cavenderia fasciculata]|uniref:MORN repeat-containing protein n=1 Tax=Cavenderia fasciculata TaxID=261658 RepID=F4PHJ4_CACFS|nr:MORN repeat-containing protein [Cavenderia fasciculata]EGG25178.1 MORN repeat-containing protein [Cavenderia fasciculata]|eukprot:XP_004363029.1 MORN repeat-containing protein [Cavenderia fasciculata]
MCWRVYLSVCLSVKMDFDVIRPPSYSYDVIIKSNNEKASIHSNYGFYQGKIDDSMYKEGEGVFLHPTCTYVGEWKNDQKCGDGILIVNDGYKTFQELSSIIPPTAVISANKDVGFKTTGSLENQVIINGPGNQNYQTKSKTNQSFTLVDSVIVKVQTPEYLSTRDYYQGKWASSRANGIGSFHFAKNKTVQEEFWRNGVAIRYYNNENQLLKLIDSSIDKSNQLQTQQLPSSPPQKSPRQQQQQSQSQPLPPQSPQSMSSSLATGTLPQNDELKRMLDDWKVVVGTFDDFPIAKPYLGSASTTTFTNGTTAQNLHPNEDDNNDLRRPMIRSPNKVGEFLTSSSSTASSVSSGLSSSISSPSVSSSIQSNANGNGSLKQAFGVVTSRYLKNRLEQEDKFFVTLLRFISIWELPLISRASDLPGSGSDNGYTPSNFMIVVPDLESGSFVTLSTLVMQSTIVEKMVFKLLTDPLTKNNVMLEPEAAAAHQGQGQGQAHSIIPTPEENELYKLLPFSLELDIEDAANSKHVVEPIIATLKHFTKAIDNFDNIPVFLVHHICDIVSEQFILLLSKINLNRQMSPRTALNGSNGISSTSSSNLSSTATTPRSAAASGGGTPPILQKQPSSLSSTTTGVRTNQQQQQQLKQQLQQQQQQQPSLSKTNSNNVNSIQNQLKQQQPIANNLKNQFQKQSTIDNINKYYDIQSNNKQSNFVDLSLALLDPIVLEYIFYLFKETFDFIPNALESSVDLLKKVSKNIGVIKQIMLTKINLFKESKGISNQEVEPIKIGATRSKSSYSDYLKTKDQEIENFIVSQEKEVELFDQTMRTFDKLFILLYRHLVRITIGRLTLAVQFINRIKQSENFNLLPKDYIVRFIKHVHNIVMKIQSITTNITIQIDKDISDSIKSFLEQNNNIFSLLKSVNQLSISSSPQQLSQQQQQSLQQLVQQQPTSTSFLNGFMGMVLGKRNYTSEPSTSSSSSSVTPTPTSLSSSSSSSSSTSTTEPNGANQSGNTTTTTSQEDSVIILSPLHKISKEIIHGNYQHIILLSSCGDELLVTFLGSILAETRSNLKDKSDESTQHLVNILLKSAVCCQFKSYRTEVFKSIAQLSKICIVSKTNQKKKNIHKYLFLLILIYFFLDKEKDELFQQYKDNLKIFMDISLKDDAYTFSPNFCLFLTNIYPSLSTQSKREFSDLFPLQNFIEMLDKSNNCTKANRPSAESLRIQSAQILIYLAKYSYENLVELKNKGSLSHILEICKHGAVFSHIKIEESDLVIGEFLGAGALARVNRGLWNGKEVAIKIFSEVSFTFRLEDFLKEVAIMGLIQHPNLLKLEGACIIPRSVDSIFMIVTEIMHKGTLWDVVKKNHPLSLQLVIKYAVSVAKGLAYLHSIDIIHRDIKAANILIDKYDNAKVGDFGLSRVTQLNMTAVAGTPKWEAPECLAGDLYTSAADVYSFDIKDQEQLILLNFISAYPIIHQT